MVKKQSGRFDAAGWTFWLIAFGVSLAPCIYGVMQVVRDKTSVFVIVFFGALGAGAAAAVITWLVNSALQFIRARERKLQKKSHR